MPSIRRLLKSAAKPGSAAACITNARSATTPKKAELGDGKRGETLDYHACGNSKTLGPAKLWLQPPGFAHPVYVDENTEPEDAPARSYATRAKLDAPTPPDQSQWNVLNPRIRTQHLKKHLLVTNRGPEEEGYDYCTKCGSVEPFASPTSQLGSAHDKPYPDPKEPKCEGNGTTRGIVLGTDFITDILLISLTIEDPVILKPSLGTDIALRTASEALSKAATLILELESGELQGEFRPALTPLGQSRESRSKSTCTTPCLAAQDSQKRWANMA